MRKNMDSGRVRYVPKGVSIKMRGNEGTNLLIAIPNMQQMQTIRESIIIFVIQFSVEEVVAKSSSSTAYIPIQSIHKVIRIKIRQHTTTPDHGTNRRPEREFFSLDMIGTNDHVLLLIFSKPSSSDLHASSLFIHSDSALKISLYVHVFFFRVLKQGNNFEVIQAGMSCLSLRTVKLPPFPPFRNVPHSLALFGAPLLNGLLITRECGRKIRQLESILFPYIFSRSFLSHSFFSTTHFFSTKNVNAVEMSLFYESESLACYKDPR